MIQQTELLENSAFPLLKDQFPSENNSKVFMEQIKIVKIIIVGARAKLFIETIYCNSLQFSNSWCSWIFSITTGDLSWQFCLFWIFFSYLQSYMVILFIFISSWLDHIIKLNLMLLSLLFFCRHDNYICSSFDFLHKLTG